MPAVFIYHQRKLEYVVLPNRRIFIDTDQPDLIGPIRAAERHPFWNNPAQRNPFLKEGEDFFKSNEEYLGSLISMADVDGKMSQGFFLYLTFRRFQNQLYQASIVNNSDLQKIDRKKFKRMVPRVGPG